MRCKICTDGTVSPIPKTDNKDNVFYSARCNNCKSEGESATTERGCLILWRMALTKGAVDKKTGYGYLIVVGKYG